MHVLKHGRLLVATRISGPSHNFLGLDFDNDRTPYEQDLADPSKAGAVSATSVLDQVAEAVDAHQQNHDVRLHPIGIVYLSTDTPTTTAYRELAAEILAAVSHMDTLDTFEPPWEFDNPAQEPS